MARGRADGGAVPRGTTDLARLARELEVGGQDTADYFVSEVLEQQPPELGSSQCGASPTSAWRSANTSTLTLAERATSLLRSGITRGRSLVGHLCVRVPGGCARVINPGR